jgi:hypothetical protein
MPESLFTPSQVAQSLEAKRQTIQAKFAAIEPDGIVLVRGSEAKGYLYEHFPNDVRDRLERRARKQGYRDGHTMLTSPDKRWEPAIPITEVTEKEIRRAEMLRSALRRALQALIDGILSCSECEDLAVADFQAVFGGKPKSKRYMRKLLTRTRQRDGGAGKFERLELYLSDKPKRKITAEEVVGAAIDGVQDEEFIELFDVITACAVAPKPKERDEIWDMAFEIFRRFVARGMRPNRAARRVRDFLHARAPFLAPNRSALRKQFRYWIDRPHKDLRCNNGAHFDLPEEDRDQLVHLAAYCFAGGVVPAWRDLMTEETADPRPVWADLRRCGYSGFSALVRRRYAGKAFDKSYIPKSVLDDVYWEVEILTVMARGKRSFDSIKGHVTRNYDNVFSLQCMVADDFTFNSYFSVPNDQGWFNITRGQVILFIDFRSLRVLGWALEPRGSYSSLTIRSLCTRLFMEFGVPDVLQFERGIWKSATILKGKKDPLTMVEVSQGLREFGIQFIHSIRPRSKTIEKVGGIIQDMSEAEPGNASRDERRYAPECLHKQIEEVERGKTHPDKYFYSFEQWNRRLGELFARYNATPQQGHILRGLSPDQAFEEFMNPNDPPKQFTPELRYLLAHEKREKQVTLNGITLEFGKKKFTYRGPEIAHLVPHREKVLTWFDPENPDVLVVTDLNRENPICVNRAESPGALECLVDPSNRKLATELRRIEDQASYVKTRYNVLNTKFQRPQRRLLATQQQIDTGREIETKKQNLALEKANRDRTRRAYGRMNMPVPDDPDPDQVRSAEILARHLSKPSPPQP